MKTRNGPRIVFLIAMTLVFAAATLAWLGAFENGFSPQGMLDTLARKLAEAASMF